MVEIVSILDWVICVIVYDVRYFVGFCVIIYDIFVWLKCFWVDVEEGWRWKEE